MNFKSPSFEIYIKSLDTLKSHLRNDDEESEKNEDNILLDEKEEESSEKKEDEKEKGKKGKKGKNDKKKEEQNEHKKKNKEKIQKMRILKNQKIKAMTSYFLHNNIFFIIRVMFVFLFSLSYFILTFILEKKNKNHLLKVDSAVNSVEGIYKTSYDNFFSIKSIIEPYLEFEISRLQAISRLESDNDSSKIEFDGQNYTKDDISIIKNIPNNKFYFNSSQVYSTPKIGNLLMSLINDNGLNGKLINRLNILYSGDSCSILFENITSSEYDICSTFWSSILVKGMEQSITQMSVVLNTVIDELNSVQNGIKGITDILAKGSAYNQFEFFVEYYLLLAYWESSKIFDKLKVLKIDSIFKIYLIIMIVYFVVSLIMIIFVIKVVYSSRDVLNSFLNFIGIFPIKYIIEDSDLTTTILKLEGKLY